LLLAFATLATQDLTAGHAPFVLQTHSRASQVQLPASTVMPTLQAWLGRMVVMTAFATRATLAHCLARQLSVVHAPSVLQTHSRAPQAQQAASTVMPTLPALMLGPRLAWWRCSHQRIVLVLRLAVPSMAARVKYGVVARALIQRHPQTPGGSWTCKHNKHSPL